PPHDSGRQARERDCGTYATRSGSRAAAGGWDGEDRQLLDKRSSPVRLLRCDSVSWPGKSRGGGSLQVSIGVGVGARPLDRSLQIEVFPPISGGTRTGRGTMARVDCCPL